MTWDPRVRRPFRREPPFDPMPRGGLLEQQAALCFARYGEYPEQFVEIARKYPAHRLFDRLRPLVERYKRERPWEEPEDPSIGAVYILPEDRR